MLNGRVGGKLRLRLEEAAARVAGREGRGRLDLLARGRGHRAGRDEQNVARGSQINVERGHLDGAHTEIAAAKGVGVEVLLFSVVAVI